MANRLPVFATLRGAAEDLFLHRAVLLRALALPSALLALVEYIATPFQDSTAVFVGLLVPYALLATVFAVSCHRVLILGEDALPSRWGVFWSVREIRFAGWGVIFALHGAGLLALVGFGLAVLLGPWVFESELAMTMVVAAVGVPWIYYFSRSSLVLPAVATGERVGLLEVSRWSHSVGWRLVVVIWVPAAVVYLANWGIRALAGEISPGILAVPLDAIGFLLGAIEVAALSEAYGRLAPAANGTAG